MAFIIHPWTIPVQLVSLHGRELSSLGELIEVFRTFSNIQTRSGVFSQLSGHSEDYKNDINKKYV